MQLGVAIIGCGLIGEKRSHHLLNCKLLVCVDTQKERADKLAAKFPECQSFNHWKAVMDNNNIHIVIISTPHYSLAEITMAAIKAGKHILVEKPAARSAKELEPVWLLAKTSQSIVRVGFNHRYHRAFQKARALVDAGELGNLMFIRARYGHGGRIGYNTEWRANEALSGGGELIDQGVHLIDLSRWFLGDFKQIEGFAKTYFWNMAVDDNAFLLLKTETEQTAFLQASCTEWKNLFSFEIYGKLGKIDVQGLGGSYGTEKITFYKMLPEMGPPETYSWEYPMADNSWEIEFQEFVKDIESHQKSSPSLSDAYAALKIVEEIYRKSKT